jgi:hypothetical protein
MLFKNHLLLLIITTLYAQEYEFKKQFKAAIETDNIREALNILCEVNKESPKNRALIDFFSTMFQKKWGITILDLARISLDTYDKKAISEKINLLQTKVTDIINKIPHLENACK